MAQKKDAGDRCTFDLTWPASCDRIVEEDEGAKPEPTAPVLRLLTACPISITDLRSARADFCQDSVRISSLLPSLAVHS
jgi:hypothetical protein